MRLHVLFVASILVIGCKNRGTDSQTSSSEEGKSSLIAEGEDADEFFDVLDVAAERHLEDEEGDNVLSKKQFAATDGKFNVNCELGSKVKNCTFAFGGTVTKNTVGEQQVWEMLLTDHTAQQFYDVLDVPEQGTEAIQPPVFEKFFESESGRFSVKCMLTKEKKECALRKNVGTGPLSLLFD